MTQVIRNNRKKQKRITQRLLIVVIVEVCILVMMSFAWYYYQAHRRVYSEDREVMPPYCLYLVEPGGMDALNMTIGNLHPGELKQVVLGVSNRAPQSGGESFTISKDSNFNYELEIAYTKNLPIEYKVYELEEVSDTSTEINVVEVEWQNQNSQSEKHSFTKKLLNKTAESQSITDKNNHEMYGEDLSSIVNLGQYDVYDNTSGASFDLTTKVVDDNSIEFDMDYYLLEIQWQDNITFSDYLKETDLVYVVVKALQLEPKEKISTP